MIVLTGAAGFIGSCILAHLNLHGVDDTIIVDHLDTTSSWKNLIGKSFSRYLDKNDLFSFLEKSNFAKKIDLVIHMGACSSTTETDADYLLKNNFLYSQNLATWCFTRKIRFIYASSAAVYGDGSQGYSDDHAKTFQLRPLNMYGFSKLLFDQWIIRNHFDTQSLGMRFFNVYGPNEYHKQEMRSVALKGYLQIKKDGHLKLFRSYHPAYLDGEQKRDFIYVKDILSIVDFFLNHPSLGGIFNIGTGNASTWNQLGKAIFSALALEEKIQYIDMPEDLRSAYQYYTCADMEKLRNAGFSTKLSTIFEGIQDYASYFKEERYL